MKIVKGDLLALAEAGEFDIIVQGCNCFCTMGSGIAKQIRAKYPQAYRVDSQTMSGDIDKLGSWTQADAPKFTIVNAYTQFDYNRPGDRTDRFEYLSFELILQKLAYLAPTKRYGFPMIGMGLAGGDKDRIMGLLLAFAEKISYVGGSVTVVEYDQ